MRTARRNIALALLAAALGFVAGCGGQSSGAATEVRIPLGAGGVGFLPLFVMRDRALIEKHASAAGLTDLTVRWIDLGGPAVMNDALLSGSVDFIAAGPPAFITLWDRTRGSADVRGVAAMSSLPMYLNTTHPTLTALDELTETDKIAVTAVKVSIPSIVMQMYAAGRYGAAEAFRFDRYTVTMTHPDALIALLSGGNQINAHFTSPPFHQREIEDPRVRTILNTDDIMGGATTFTMLSTTARYREANPAAYAAVLAALEEANELIRTDPRAAAEILFAAESAAGFTVDELVEVLQDPDIRFTTTPENTQKYAEFMQEIGSIENRPSSWRDLFFPDIHTAAGS
jgi:NitT/TauT family transport system substrate-binding protein